ncbi:MAG: YicC family protein [Cyclobacteriaceae bacterium]|nr:YicC family protein [Cyclobacteriaceae bacterium]
MIKSMTGFGQASTSFGDVKISAEVKSLNSKFMDLGIRLPRNYSDREIEVRNLVTEKLERGKVSVTIECERIGSVPVQQYNEELFISHYSALKKLADRVMAPYDNLFELALNSPDVLENNGRDEIDAEEWQQVVNCIEDAIRKCEDFRLAEGKALQKKLESYCESIESGLAIIETLDPKRVEKIRTRIKGRVEDFFGEEGFDENRLEQEIIFYIEKLDIHEERVRLKTHLDYFQQVLKSNVSNGKKLGFISQEIGREINTIGSKANDAEIQKHVVMMKEELEKIKEQLGNVL